MGNASEIISPQQPLLCGLKFGAREEGGSPGSDRERQPATVGLQVRAATAGTIPGPGSEPHPHAHPQPPSFPPARRPAGWPQCSWRPSGHWPCAKHCGQDQAPVSPAAASGLTSQVTDRRQAGEDAAGYLQIPGAP